MLFICRKNQKILLKNFKNYSFLKNPFEINDFLKKNENFNIIELKEIAQNYQIDKIHIYKLNNSYEFFFKYLRFQNFSLILICLPAFISYYYNQETKLSEKETKKKKKYIPFLAFSFGILGLSIFFYILSKRLVLSMFYLPKQNIIEIEFLKFFGNKKSIFVKPSEISKVKGNKFKDISFEYKLINIKGYKYLSTNYVGIWNNVNIINIIINNN